MHHSSAVQSPPDQPFLSEYKNSKKRKEKQKETVIDIGEDETDEKKLMQRHFDTNKDVSRNCDAITAHLTNLAIYFSGHFIIIST